MLCSLCGVLANISCLCDWDDWGQCNVCEVTEVYTIEHTLDAIPSLCSTIVYDTVGHPPSPAV